MKFDIIYADPPWHYNDNKTGGERNNKNVVSGGARKHYPLMKDQDIYDLGEKVKSISAENSVLFLWATFPKLQEALKTIDAWGFTYKTNAFTWVKLTKDGTRPVYGPGYYTASNAEVCLLATKGSLGRTPYVESMIQTPRQDHSKKPIDAMEKINQLYPDKSKLELFARPYEGYLREWTDKNNWTFWGNEFNTLGDL